MAVYGADVRVKVINLAQLTKLSDKLDQVNKKVNYLNASLEKLGKRVKTPKVNVDTDKALRKLQRLNKEWDKLEKRKALKTPTAPAGGGRGGGGGRRGGGGAFGKNLLQGGLAGAGLGLAGPAGGLAGIAASALNPVTLLGAALGVTAVAAADYAGKAAVAAAETQKFKMALQGITFGDDYGKALESVTTLSDQFQQDLGETTKQFTKLTAAATANGLTIEETEKIYKGLASANLALGGDNERLQGILLATGQVLSKGKVQAEELRGQIGERLPGAFALFAEAIGKTPKELDKALNDGEVTVEDFLTFTEKLFKRFSKNAEEIVNGPAAAGQRLEKALGDLQRNVGILLQPIGAAFQDIFTEIIKVINAAAISLQNFLGIGVDGAINKTLNDIETTYQRINALEKGQKEGRTGQGGQTGPKSRLGRELEEQKERLAALYVKYEDLLGQQQGKAPNAPTKPVETELPDTGKGSGSKGSTPRESRVAEYQRELNLLLSQNELAKSTLGLRDKELKQIELINREINAYLETEKEISDIIDSDLYKDEKQIKIKIAEAKLDSELTKIAREKLELQFAATDLFEENEKALLRAIELESAISEEHRNQIVLKQALADIDGLDLSDERKNRLKELTEQRAAIQADNAKPVNQYMKQLDEDLNNTQAMVVSLAQTVETELASAMSSAVTGLITGTKTAQEAFAEMFANIGKAFVDMATQMIAKALVMKALGILTGGATPPEAATPLPEAPINLSSAQKVGWPGQRNYEGGGYTGMGPRAGGLDGRGGFMAMVHPDETIIDHRSPMGRYSGGNSPSNGGAMTINFQTQMINNVEYVTKDEAMAMSRAAANDGARRGAQSGHARSMQTLQNSRSQRAKLGMS